MCFCVLCLFFLYVAASRQCLIYFLPPPLPTTIAPSSEQCPCQNKTRCCLCNFWDTHSVQDLNQLLCSCNFWNCVI